jgi:hypothetical protein
VLDHRGFGAPLETPFGSLTRLFRQPPLTTFRRYRLRAAPAYWVRNEIAFIQR